MPPLRAAGISEIGPVWNAQGDSKYHLVDSADGLFDEESSLLKTSSLRESWKPPILVVVAVRKPADVYFCPSGCYFFSERAKNIVEPLVAADAEWLQVAIQGLGIHFALHPLRQARLAAPSKYRVNEVSGNIVELTKAVFDADAVGSSTIFYASQAAGSAAEQGGFCFPSVFVKASVGAAISANLSGLHVKAHSANEI
jgi:hypothetical protein